MDVCKFKSLPSYKRRVWWADSLKAYRKSRAFKILQTI